MRVVDLYAPAVGANQVVRAAALHAADVHGHKDTPELREQLREMLTDGRTERCPRVEPGGRAAPRQLMPKRLVWDPVSVRSNKV